jgi:hypothetical protein
VTSESGTHLPLHRYAPGKHVGVRQVPPLHAAVKKLTAPQNAPPSSQEPNVQSLLQLPQCAAVVSRSTQLPLQ